MTPPLAPYAQSPPQAMQSPTTPVLITYKAMPFDVNSQHEVFVSYVSDGPCLFSVQLVKLEDTLKRLMMDITTIKLIHLEEHPLPGTVCLAESAEDGYICRAVVTSMVDGAYKVSGVSFFLRRFIKFCFYPWMFTI